MLSVYELPMFSVHLKATTLYALTKARGMCLTEKRPLEGSVPASASALRRVFESLFATHAPNWQKETTATKHAMNHQTSCG